MKTLAELDVIHEEARKELSAKHEEAQDALSHKYRKESSDLRSVQGDEYQKLKMAQLRERRAYKTMALGMDYGMTEERMMAHIANSIPASPPPTLRSLQDAFNSLQKEFDKDVKKSFGIFPDELDAYSYAAQDILYREQLKERGIDNNNKHYGTKTGRFSSGFHHIQSMPRSERIVYPGSPFATDFGESPKCECGAHKVQGPNCSARMHSTWCPLHGDS